MNGKRVHIWNCKDCLKAWQKLHTPKQAMKHRIWLHASVTHSTRWAWPPVHWGDTNTSIQWSTTLCHQVVFACAFGAVSTTQGEASCSNMETGASIILLSAYSLRTMDLTNNIFNWIVRGAPEHYGLQIICNNIVVFMLIYALCAHVRICLILLYLCWFVTWIREHNCILAIL